MKIPHATTENRGTGSPAFISELAEARFTIIQGGGESAPIASIKQCRKLVADAFLRLQFDVTRRLPMTRHEVVQSLRTIAVAAIHGVAYLRDSESCVAQALDIVDEIGRLHLKKSADYGTDADPFANVRASQFWGIRPWIGAMVRAGDKVQRIDSFAAKGELANEPIEDAWIDLACYALIAIVLFREDREP